MTLNSNLVGISTNITLSNKVAQAKLTRIGNLVIFESPQDASRISANYEDIGTIPVGYRPSTPYVNIPIGNIADTNRRYIRITSAGIVQQYSSTASASAINDSAIGVWVTLDTIPD